MYQRGLEPLTKLKDEHLYSHWDLVNKNDFWYLKKVRDEAKFHKIILQITYQGWGDSFYVRFRYNGVEIAFDSVSLDDFEEGDFEQKIFAKCWKLYNFLNFDL